MGLTWSYYRWYQSQVSQRCWKKTRPVGDLPRYFQSRCLLSQAGRGEEEDAGPLSQDAQARAAAHVRHQGLGFHQGRLRGAVGQDRNMGPIDGTDHPGSFWKQNFWMSYVYKLCISCV